MRLLLDAQVLIWFPENNKSLLGRLNNLISEGDNQLIVASNQFIRGHY